MNFSAQQAYQLCYWLDNLPSFPPTTPPAGWELAFAPIFLYTNYAVVLTQQGNSAQFAVVILGTHDKLQVAQDLEIGNPQPFVNPYGQTKGQTIITDAQVSNGVSSAFSEVLNLKLSFRGQETLGGYLTGVVWSQSSVLVTGHSLGGTLASMMAPWLASVIQGTTPVTPPLPAQIQAVTFAAFAAGNQQFVDYLNGSPQYQPNINLNDIVPYVWATTGDYQVSSVYSSFPSPGPPMPQHLQNELTDVVKTIPAGFNYIQTNNPTTFSGIILPAPSFSTCGLTQEQLEEAQWNWEVSLQHNYAYCVEYIGTGCQEPSSGCPGQTEGVIFGAVKK